MDSIIDIVEVRVSAKAGASIGGCLKACIELASKEWRNVRLTHGGKDYMIRPNDLIAACEEVSVLVEVSHKTK